MNTIRNSRLNILILTITCGFQLLLISCTNSKIRNVTEARHFLATHTWEDANAQFKNENGKVDLHASSMVTFTEKEVNYNKENSPYDIVKMPGGPNDINSHNPYFIISWWDTYSSSTYKFYLMEDGQAWLASIDVDMSF